MKTNYDRLLILIFLCSLNLGVFAFEPPHPNGGSTPGGGSQPLGGGAPLDGGTSLFVMLGLAYTVRKTYLSRSEKGKEDVK